MHFFFNPQKKNNKLLLDELSQSAVAYSLRKLRTAYSGSAIRVRRSSDNTEQDIGFTASGDLDTTALSSFVGAGNGFVTTWYDQSVNGNHAVQAIAAAQPPIVESGVIHTQNSKPSIKYDGVQAFSLTSTISNVTDFSVYFVINPAEDSVAKTGAIPVGSTGNVQFRIGIGGYAIFSFFDVTNFVSSDGGVNLSSMSQCGFVRSGSTVSYHQNGAGFGSASAGETIAINLLNSEPAKNSTSEILIFTTAHSATQRALVEANQMKYHSVSNPWNDSLTWEDSSSWEE